MSDKAKRREETIHPSKKSATPQDAGKSADPKQVGKTGNIQQNTINRRHQQQREER